MLSQLVKKKLMYFSNKIWFNCYISNFLISLSRQYFHCLMSLLILKSKVASLSFSPKFSDSIIFELFSLQLSKSIVQLDALKGDLSGSLPAKFQSRHQKQFNFDIIGRRTL